MKIFFGEAIALYRFFINAIRYTRKSYFYDEGSSTKNKKKTTKKKNRGNKNEIYTTVGESGDKKGAVETFFISSKNGNRHVDGMASCVVYDYTLTRER